MDRVVFRVITLDATAFFAWLEKNKDAVTNGIVVFDDQHDVSKSITRTGVDIFTISVEAEDMVVMLDNCSSASFTSYQSRVKELELFPVVGQLRQMRL